VDEALNMFLAQASPEKLRTENIPLGSALNRVLAEAVVTSEDLPRFDRSAVDGYAVKAKDTQGASQFKPRILRLSATDIVGSNQARELWTGNPLPRGADAVAMLESTKQIGDGKLEVWVRLTPGENVSRKGEDLQKGEIAVKAGVRLKPQHLGLLASIGKTTVAVAEKPKAAVLVTGNELAPLGSERRKNQIFDSNSVTICSLCRELGAESVDLGIAKDDAEEILRKLRVGLDKADLILTTGGTSVGALDLVPEAVGKLGKPGIIVHGVAMRPAMPTALALVNGKPVIILSGNPVAAMVAFEVFARPLICKMLGMKRVESRPFVKAEMVRRVSTALGRRTFVRVKVFREGEAFFAEPVSARGSGLLSTMTRANGYVVVPENREGIGQGEHVLVYLFDDLELSESV